MRRSRQVTTGVVATVLGIGGLLAVAPAQADDPAGSTGPTTSTAAPSPAAGSERSALGLGPGQALVVKDRMRDPNGTVTVRYDRTYRGLPVVGGDLLVHRLPDGRTSDVQWASHADVSAVGSVLPTVAAATAVQHAVTRSGLASVAERRLVVWAVGDTARLAYQVTTAGREDGAPAEQLTYVDARSGSVLRSFSALQHLGAKGVGRTLYSGTVPLTTTRANGRYVLKDPSRGGQTVHLYRGTRKGKPVGPTYTDRDNRWGNHRASNGQSAAADAAFGASKTWDFYTSMFGRKGIRGDGRGAASFVHVTTGRRHRPLDNAFWSDRCFCMSYGDGAKYFRPLVQLDVTGHEMTHGVTSHTAGLLYFGESGGLNEGTSDIMGTGVEFFAHDKQDPGDYLLGEEITKVAPGYLRRMDRPSADGASYDCWTPTMGQDDPHYTSGVANHFFYLAAMGSGSRSLNGVSYNSPTCNSSTVAPIGRDKALRVWYRALTHYMVSTTGYTEARDDTIRAALDLYPSNPSVCAGVVSAWDALSVPAGDWTCGAAPAKPKGNTVRNPGFNQGGKGWTTNHARQRPFYNRGLPAHSGRTFAGLDNTGTTRTDIITQKNVTVPLTSPRLRFWALVFSAEAARDGAQDTLTVQVVPASGTPSTVLTLSDENANATWTKRTVSLSSFAGQSVTLKFIGQENAQRATGFALDDVTVTSN